MNPFDYLTILVSIVLGLAMTNVLTRLAIVVSARERVDFYWPPIAWAMWIFFISIQHWWAAWSTHHVREWTFLTFCTGLLDPIILFFLSALVLPDRDEGGVIDLGVWYIQAFKGETNECLQIGSVWHVGAQIAAKAAVKIIAGQKDQICVE